MFLVNRRHNIQFSSSLSSFTDCSAVDVLTLNELIKPLLCLINARHLLFQESTCRKRLIPWKIIRLQWGSTKPWGQSPSSKTTPMQDQRLTTIWESGQIEPMTVGRTESSTLGRFRAPRCPASTDDVNDTPWQCVPTVLTQMAALGWRNNRDVCARLARAVG